MKVLVVDENCKECEGMGVMKATIRMRPSGGQVSFREVCDCVRAVELVAAGNDRILRKYPDGTSEPITCHYPLVEKP